MIKLLYVDDDETLLDLAKCFLETDDSIMVDTCLSAHEALNDLDLGSYDLIVSDYQMPRMDGIEFLKTVRSEWNDIPFILFTGKGREEVAIDAINLGADFYLPKGGDPRSQYFELVNVSKQLVSRRRAEIAIRNNEARMEAILNTSRDIIAVIDERGTIEYISPSVEHVLGHSIGELINKKIRNFVHPGDHAIIDKMLINFQSGSNGCNEVSYRILKKDRSWAILSCVGTVMPCDGIIRKAVINARDDTEKLMAKQREIEWRTLIKNMSEGVDDGIAILQRGGIVYCNQSLQRMIGRPMDELVHSPFTAYLDTKDATIAVERYSKRLRGVELGDSFDAILLSEDGTEVQVTIFGHLISYEGMPADLAIIKDKTAMNRTANTLNEYKANFSVLLDHMDGGCVVYEIQRDRWNRPFDLRTIMVNDEFKAIFNKQQEDLIGLGLERMFDSDESSIQQCLLDSIKRKEPLSLDIYHCTLGKALSLSSFYLGEENYVTIFSDLSRSIDSEEMPQKVGERAIVILNDGG